MRKDQQHIARIKKYNSGQLDARAMHQLEREALDDPFLADALEGYQSAVPGQEANLAELQQRLQLRVEPKVRQMIAWRQLAIAASILIFFGICTWYFLPTKKGNTLQLVENIKPAAQDKQSITQTPAASTDATDAKPSGSQSMPNNTAFAPALKAEKGLAGDKNISTAYSKPVQADTAVLGAKSASPLNTDEQLKSPSFAGVAKAKSIDKQQSTASLNEVEVAQADASARKKAVLQVAAQSNKASRQETLIQSKVDGVVVTPANKTLSGTVTGLNGMPLPGAVVKLAGSNFGVITDEKGRFVMHDVPEKDNITVGYIGYSQKQIRVNGEDSVNVSLSPANDLRNTGSMDSHSTTDAHPSAGWKALENYLAKNASLADGQTGKVNLSFSVDAQGNLSNFKILKSLSNAADQKAIDLLVHGPGWIGNADSKVHEVKLTVEFR